MKNQSNAQANCFSLFFFLFVLFSSSILTAQTEMYKPDVKNRPTQKIQLRLPGSVKSQEVVVEKVNNAYILEGDMMVYPTDQNAAGITQERRWPKGIIPFKIQSGHPFTMNIMAAIEDINRLTNLTLIPRTSQKNYVKIVYDADDGCWSNIGIRKSSVNKISLGDGCGGKGTITHELMHTAGMFHEQSRTDRDRYIRINKSNIKSDKLHNFSKYKCNYDGVDIGTYDYGSIMHYSRFAFAKDRSKPTIETIPAGRQIGQRSGLSPKDIAGVNAMYPNRQKSGNQYDWVTLNASHTVLKSNTYFSLQNITSSKAIKYKKRKYGINLKWTENLNYKNFRFVMANRSTRDLINGDKVAIYVKGKGYLKYKKRKYGINIVWSDTPVYQWVLYSSGNKKIIAGKPFSIYNTLKKDYFVYCKRKYGINLRWTKDCSGVSSVPPSTINRPRPRPVNNGTVVSPSRTPVRKKPSAKRTNRLSDHRKKKR